jgi:hypothetical protein
VITLLALTAVASAQTLTWDWAPDTVRTWHIETVVQYANPIWLQAEHNIEGRAKRIHSEQVWTCRAGEPSRMGWELSCTVDDARLVVAALETEEIQVQAVLAELDAALTGATVQLQLDRSGHLRSVDLEGITKDNRRSGAIHETLRLLVARSAVAFDLHLPPSGDLLSAWRQKDDLLYSYPISFGTLSGARVNHTLGDHNDRHVNIQSVGTGTVRVGEPSPNPRAPPGSGEPWMLDLDSEAQALWDGVDGTLVARRWVAVGRPIASSGWQVGKKVEPYLQTGILTLIPPGTQPPSLGQSGLWTVDFAPGPAWKQLLSNPLWRDEPSP